MALLVGRGADLIRIQEAPLGSHFLDSHSSSSWKIAWFSFACFQNNLSWFYPVKFFIPSSKGEEIYRFYLKYCTAKLTLCAKMLGKSFQEWGGQSKKRTCRQLQCAHDFGECGGLICKLLSQEMKALCIHKWNIPTFWKFHKHIKICCRLNHLPPYSSLFPIKEAFCSVLCLGLAKWEDLRFSEDMMCSGVGWTWIHLDKSNKKAFQLFACSWHLIPVFCSKPVVAGLWIRWKFLCPDSHVPCPCLFGVHDFLSSFTIYCGENCCVASWGPWLPLSREHPIMNGATLCRKFCTPLPGQQ